MLGDKYGSPIISYKAHASVQMKSHGVLTQAVDMKGCEQIWDLFWRENQLDLIDWMLGGGKKETRLIIWGQVGR